MKTAMIIVIAVVAVLAGLIALGELRWRRDTDADVARLRVKGVGELETRFRVSQLEGLPEPVHRYFLAALREGQPLHRRARLLQSGRFLIDAAHDKWVPFTAVQEMVSGPAGFVWDARMRVAPGLAVLVRDGFVEGRGAMLGSFMGLWAVLRAEGGPEISAAALQRYLAVAAWMPTALLPSAGVVWSPLDDFNARATLSEGDAAVSLDFRFGADSLIASAYAAERFREEKGVYFPTPWRGRWLAYEERGGMRIPVAGEVEWLLPAGPQVYWRGRIDQVEYGKPSGVR
jgi:hypothetical protein